MFWDEERIISTQTDIVWISSFLYIKNSPWHIHLCSSGLRSDLENKLVGQHIASPLIFKAVAGFMKTPHPKKPLVLSLHGPTGTGKNFVAQIIADNIYKKGNISQFVHVFTYKLNFPHASQIETYKVGMRGWVILDLQQLFFILFKKNVFQSQLQQWIKGNVSRCAHSMFVFDEVDKIHPGLIDSIHPYLDHHNQLEGVSYKNTIFIFLRWKEKSYFHVLGLRHMSLFI